jgi:hypothetical protein
MTRKKLKLLVAEWLVPVALVALAAAAAAWVLTPVF